LGLGEEVYRTQHEGLQPRHKYLITRVETDLTNVNLECKRTKIHLTTVRSFLCDYKAIVAFIEIDEEASTSLTCSSYLYHNMQENNFVWLRSLDFSNPKFY